MPDLRGTLAFSRSHCNVKPVYHWGELSNSYEIELVSRGFFCQPIVEAFSRRPHLHQSGWARSSLISVFEKSLRSVSPHSCVSRGGGVCCLVIYGNQYMSGLLLVLCCCCRLAAAGWLLLLLAVGCCWFAAGWLLLLLADCCRCCCLLLGCCWCCCLLLAAACRCRCSYSFAACHCFARPMIIAGFFHCRLGIGNMISSLVAGLFGETRCLHAETSIARTLPWLSRGVVSQYMTGCHSCVALQGLLCLGVSGHGSSGQACSSRPIPRPHLALYLAQPARHQDQHICVSKGLFNLHGPSRQGAICRVHVFKRSCSHFSQVCHAEGTRAHRRQRRQNAS